MKKTFITIGLSLLLSVESYAATSIGLAWDFNLATPVDSFELERSIDNQVTWEHIASIPFPALAFTYSTNEEGKTHFYKVRAKKGGAFGSYAPTQIDPSSSVLKVVVPTPFVIPSGLNFRGGVQ